MPPAFTPEQLRILRLFELERSEEEWREIRELIEDYLFKKAAKSAEKAWNERGYTNEDVEKWLKSDLRSRS